MRTDVQLQRDVIDEIGAEPMLDANRIDVDVEVRNGTVFLIGQVEGFAEKSAAERAAYRATGRRAMSTRLSIKRSCPASGDETRVNEVRRSLEHEPNKIHRALE